MNRTHLRSVPPTQRAKTLPPRDHAGTMIAKVAQARFPSPQHAVFTEVRSHIGPGAPEVLRRADMIALDFYPRGRPWRLHGGEAKTDPDDLARELDDLTKSSPFQFCCDTWNLIVPAPYKRFLRNRVIPQGWGLQEVGAGGVVEIIAPEEREAEEPTPGFLRALFRSALASAERAQETFAGIDAPLSPIIRPGLSRTHVGLGCWHVAPRPLTKILPRALPCWSCAAGLPTDFEMLEAAALEVTGEQRVRLHELLFGRTAGGAA